MDRTDLTGPWRTASYSGNNGGNCVETATVPGAVLVRDTADRDGRTLTVPAGAWREFIASVR